MRGLCPKLIPLLHTALYLPTLYWRELLPKKLKPSDVVTIRVLDWVSYLKIDLLGAV